MAVHGARLRKLGIAVLASKGARLGVDAPVSDEACFFLKNLEATCLQAQIEGSHSFSALVQSAVSLAHLEACLFTDDSGGSNLLLHGIFSSSSQVFAH